MIFCELVLENFGPYRGRQVINLSPKSNGNVRPIVLFGGMNGGGKTTLLDAIRLALYGQRTQCSTRGKLTYTEFLIQSVNYHCTWRDSTSVELTFQQTINSQPTEFKICRTWGKQLKNGKDTLGVFKDKKFDAILTSTWDERIEDLLPLGISSLFLFDGEQVKELAAQEALPQIVVDAIRSLLGLELPERLSLDLNVLVNRKRKALASQQELQTLELIEQRLEQQQQELRQANQELAALRGKLDRAIEKERQAVEKFISEGGKIAGEQSQIHAQLLQMKSDAEIQRYALVNLASGDLLLGMIRRRLMLIQNQGQKESRYQQLSAAKVVISQQNQRLMNFIERLSLLPKQASQIEAFLLDEEKVLDQTELLAGLWLNSDPEVLSSLAIKLNHSLPIQEQLAQERLASLRELEEKIDLTEGYVAAAASPEMYEKLDRAVKSAQSEVSELEAIHAKVKQHCDQRQQEIERIKQELVKYSENAIDRNNDEHLLNTAVKVQSTLTVLSERLKLRKLHKLEHTVTECFLYLLHKSNLVQRVQVDTDTFRISLYDRESDLIPKHRLSAGEQQILAVALLWGLARASGRRLPVAIDTPLGRLDSSHRTNLVERYFPEASHQVILLSTDTEITEMEVGKLRRQQAIAREYLLRYNLDKRHTVVEPGYFW